MDNNPVCEKHRKMSSSSHTKSRTVAVNSRKEKRKKGDKDEEADVHKWIPEKAGSWIGARHPKKKEV